MVPFWKQHNKTSIINSCSINWCYFFDYLDDCINWACFLAESAIDALSHVNIIPHCTSKSGLSWIQKKIINKFSALRLAILMSIPGSIWSRFCFNCDGSSRASTLAEFTSDTSVELWKKNVKNSNKKYNPFFHLNLFVFFPKSSCWFNSLNPSLHSYFLFSLKNIYAFIILVYLSSPVGYLLNACSPLKSGESGPFSKG